MITGKICGTGSYVPPHVMDNDDMAKLVDTNDEWIRERTGIARRHVAKEETTSYMAGQAALRAVEQSGIAPEEIDMILVATSSSETIYPCAACEVQRMIGAVNAAGYDLNAACTGFVLGFNAAQAYISAGMCRTVLVVGAESMSHMIDLDGSEYMYSVRRWRGSRTASCRGRRGARMDGGSFRRKERSALTGLSRHRKRVEPGRRGQRSVHPYGRTGSVQIRCPQGSGDHRRNIGEVRCECG